MNGNPSLQKRIIAAIDQALEVPASRFVLLLLTLGLMGLNLYFALKIQSPSRELRLSSLVITESAWMDLKPMNRLTVAKHLKSLNEFSEQLGLPVFTLRINDSKDLDLSDRSWITKSLEPDLYQFERRILGAWWRAQWSLVEEALKTKLNLKSNPDSFRFRPQSRSQNLSQLHDLALAGLTQLSHSWLRPDLRNSSNSHLDKSEDVPFALQLARTAELSEVDRMPVVNWFEHYFASELQAELESDWAAGHLGRVHQRRQIFRILPRVYLAITQYDASGDLNVFGRTQYHHIAVNMDLVEAPSDQTRNQDDRELHHSTLSVRNLTLCSTEVPKVAQVIALQNKYDAEIVEWSKTCGSTSMRLRQKDHTNSAMSSPNVRLRAEVLKTSVKMGWIKPEATLLSLHLNRPDLIPNGASRYAARSTKPVPLFL